MKNNTITKAVILLLMIFSGALFLSSCQSNLIDDLNNQNNTGAVFDNSERTTATFLGQILKEDGTPLEGAVVRTGANQITTDADGFFYFANINTPKNATLISVQKIGYFNAYRTIKVIPNEDNQAKIMIMELPQAEMFNAANGGIITIANGGSIDFPANAIVDKFTNQPYTGSVNVFAKWIDPSSDEINLLMPGALRGINTEYGEEGLITYGMQAVELFGDNGQPLQLGNGAKAQVKFPIPGSMQGAAPATIPLWHFDEIQGMWVEDGTAIKSGNEYVGSVSHFSFWNCDYGGPIVNFSCQLLDANNNPISGATVKLIPTSNNQLWERSALTNSSGMVTGGVPVNTTFDLEYIPAGCPWGAPSTYVQSFSSVNSNINLGSIVVSNTTSTSTTITGVVQDCNNSNLANAIVKFSIGNAIYSATTNASGQYSLSISCLSGVVNTTITAFDAANAVNGNTSATINPGVVNNLGIVQACGTQNDYITCTGMNGSTNISYTIIEPSGTFTQEYINAITRINGYDNTAYSGFEFDGPQTPAGTHNLIVYSDGNDSMTTIAPAIINLTKYENIGGKIEGSFNTTANGQFYNAATISVNFRVTRQQ